MLSIMQTLLPRIKEIGDNGPGGNYDCDDDLDNDDNEVNYDDGSEDDGEDHFRERSRRKRIFSFIWANWSTC